MTYQRRRALGILYFKFAYLAVGAFIDRNMANLVNLQCKVLRRETNRSVCILNDGAALSYSPVAYGYSA
jgi:hypothetical protein